VLPLDGSYDDLPVVLSLESRRPQVGRPGAALCRLSPHLACLDFLASLGEERQWSAGRHRLDAAQAVSLVLERLHAACVGCQGLVLALPAYLTRAQAALLTPLAEKARLPLLGSVRAPLATALVGYMAEPWSGIALVVDADDHALSVSTMNADGEQLCLGATQSWPQLSLRAWKSRLLDRVADRCIRQSRRDPRDSAPAEQSLYEQLEDALDGARQGRMVELLIQTTSWYQNLLLRPEELVAFCDRLVTQALANVYALLAAPSARAGLQRIFVTAAAGRLPGLVGGLQEALKDAVPGTDETPSADSDFGEGLVESTSGPVSVTMLTADAEARAAHGLAARIHRNELPRGHLDVAVPLPGHGAPATAHPIKRAFRLFSADPER
jgi:hypothetical protein